MTVIELRQKKTNLIKNAREVLDRVDKEKRALSQEENNHYDNILKEVDGLTDQITKLEKQEALERSISQPIETGIRPNGSGIESVETSKTEISKENFRTSKEYNIAFRDFLCTGKKAGLEETEKRALYADSDTAGGYIVAPQQFITDLIKLMDNSVFVRQMATVYQVPKAESMGVPSLTNPADPTWTGEITTVSEDSTMSFGKRELFPHALSKLIKISNKLLRKSVLGPEQIVRERFAYTFAITQENAFLNGTGAGQPLGVFTASNNGISTTYDTSTGNTTTEIRFDGLINAKYGMKPQYWTNAKWIFHPDAVKMIMKLKDGEGQYLYQPNPQMGQPDRLLGMPVLLSQYAPNTFTTGQYVGILGDFKYYWICDALDLMIQRLDELYAANREVGFIAEMETDGMPVLGEAFMRVKLA